MTPEQRIQHDTTSGDVRRDGLAAVAIALVTIAVIVIVATTLIT